MGSGTVSPHYKCFLSLSSIPEHAQVVEVRGRAMDKPRVSSARLSEATEDEEQVCHRSPVSLDNGYRKVVRVITKKEPPRAMPERKEQMEEETENHDDEDDDNNCERRKVLPKQEKKECKRNEVILTSERTAGGIRL